ncbi:hypothetical protein E2P47_01535 [Candidatus Bathyarchaeota archaeon]|nr:hypothetical protein E2P47_01535 [Candidatus Bathyarchaeota archaeon]
MVNEKILGVAGLCIVVIMVIGAFFVSSLTNSPKTQEALDFTVSGSNECLRFLSRDVGVVYVPFTTGAGEHWSLFVECTDIATPIGWVDLYLYEGYWDGGVDYVCCSEDIYLILDGVESLDYELGLDTPYSQVFGGAEVGSYTLFFIFPPGGPSSFHVTLTKLS